MFHRISPDTGYTLLLIPFLAAGFVAVSASWFLVDFGIVFALPALAIGICVSGVACGTDALVGESFNEETELRSRARVLSGGFLLAAVTLPLICVLPSRRLLRG
ncbi:MAG: hypothetical protein R3C19_23830 [Planctomycetaceae bacterium]